MATIGRKKLSSLIKSNTLLDNYEIKNIKSASYDLRIGTIYKDSKIYSEDNTNSEHPITVKPSEIISLLTLETVKIPLDSTGTVFAINSMSSRGFLILNPGHIDPGYIGPITICAINLSKESIYLYLGQSIFTLIINTLDAKLTKSEAYQKNIFDQKNRKSYEQSLFLNKFSKLSNSFFDLIHNHKDMPKIVSEIIVKRRRENWRKFYESLKSGSTIARGLYAVLGILLTLNLFKFKDSNELQNQFNQQKALYESRIDALDSLSNSIIKRNDSLIIENLNLINKYDSIVNKNDSLMKTILPKKIK